MLNRLVQVVTLPITLPIWAVLVVVHKNMEPVDLEALSLI